ncbi:MAG TPA: carboxypeptidase-like regulatory domain-containing protein, partial [Candidatus Sulfotelmatobacter sp.]|nr:carboxypeptidase-like regulatory domain-containing protein [Candidatus Sulfotelmatobacter sp.]
MRALRASCLIFIALAAASAADLKVKVVDPQSAAVSGARVSLLSKSSDTPLKISTTSAEGSANFGELTSGNYRVQI